VRVEAAAVGANTLELIVAAGAVCFVTPVSTVRHHVTSESLPGAATAVTPELVLAAGLCAVGLVAAVVTVLPSVTPPGLINAPLVTFLIGGVTFLVGGGALELLLSAGTQIVGAAITVAVIRGVAAPAPLAAAGDVAVGVTLCLSVHALHAIILPAMEVRAPPLGTRCRRRRCSTRRPCAARRSHGQSSEEDQQSGATAHHERHS